ncbi:MAG TPA: GAF domain-containing protein, partial [Devosia sp.]|nr:GAF domain-containing protein [Devosia sp.]
MPAAASAQMDVSSPQLSLRAGSAADDFTLVLDRIRKCLDISFATIRLLDGDQLRLDCSAGAPPPALERETVFCSRALAGPGPFVVPDTLLDSRLRGVPNIRFYAGIPLIIASGQTVGVLSLFDPAPRPALLAGQLAALAADAMATRAPQAQSHTVAGLQAQLRAQARLIAEQGDALAHSRQIFERAAATARIGVWECDLATEELTWTDGVYDLFELPRGSPIDRALTLSCYSDASRAVLERLRGQAVAQGIGFTLDA